MAVFALCVLANAGTTLADISVRGSTESGTTDPSGSGLTIDVPPGTSADDFMLAAIAYRPRQANLNGVPDGWTELDSFEQREGNGSGNVQAIYYRTAGPTQPSAYTWNFSGNAAYAAGGIVSYSGVDTGSPIDVYDDTDNTTGFSTTHTADSITTTIDQARLVGIFSFNSSATWTSSDGMAERVNESAPASEQAVGIALSIFDETRATAGPTGTRTAETQAQDDNGLATLLALRPAQVTPTPGFCGSDGVFSDSFEDGTVAEWTRTGGGTGDLGVDNRNSQELSSDGQYSMYTRAGAVTVDSPVIDLSGFAQARWGAWVTGDTTDLFIFGQAYYPDGNADLQLLYRTASGAWASLETFPATDNPADSPFIRSGEPLPADALHATFQFRFRQIDGERSGFFGTPVDRWRVDDICVTATGSAGIDRFVLSHDQDAITCRAEPVTLLAQDGSGDLVTDYTGSVELTTSTGNGAWSVQGSTGNGNGTLIGGGDDDGTATYEFDAADGGEVVLELENTRAETLTINADAASGPATDDNSQGSLTYRPWGFELTPNPIPDQIAGRSFDLTLTAVGEVPGGTDCSVIEEYRGDKDLTFWFDYEDPDTGGEAVTIASTNTAIEDNEADADDEPPIELNFADGVAMVPANYPDAGEIQLHVKDESGIGDPPSGSGDEVVAGGTNSFVVRPFGFHVDVPEDTGATAADATPAAARAGEAFDVTVTAVVYDVDDDDDPTDGGDGVPDPGADLSDNAPTPNFGQEATPEEATLAPTVADPAGGSNGSLSNATFATFTGGSQSKTDMNGVRWDEVGYVDLQANLVGNDYLGSGDDVTGTAAMIGRFRPDRFLLSGAGLVDRVGQACEGTSPFTYIGERFDNTFTLTAVATDDVSSSVTTNYEGNYAHLDTVGELNLAGLDQEGTERSASLLIDNPADAIGWTAGVGDIDLHLRYARNPPAAPAGAEGPYTPLRVGVAPEDGTDGVTLAGTTLDLDVDNDTADDHRETGAVELRFGRLIVDNAGGSEAADIDQALRVEFWDGSTWKVNMQDNCTTLGLAQVITLVNDAGTGTSGENTIAVGGDTTQITSGDIMIVDGTATATFDAPGAGNTGWVELTAVTGDAAPALDFLATDPDGDGTFSTDPTGRVTFGIYSGDSEWIHFRRTR